MSPNVRADPTKIDPLVQHYETTIKFIEQLLLAKTPRLVRPSSGLTHHERRQLAQQFAAGHQIHELKKMRRL